MDELTRLRNEAATASEGVARTQESLPGMLTDLRKNLVTIFQKDNPLVQAREGFLGDYLAAPDQARAEFLPEGNPIVEGSPLNFSPTQLQAMVSGRQSAALAPLLGTNEAIRAQYGTISDLVTGAGNIFGSVLEAEKTRANQVQQAFENALKQQQERRLGAQSGSGITDLASIITALLGSQDQDTGQADEWEVVEPAAPTPDSSSVKLVENQPSLWDNLIGFLGATPKPGQNKQTEFGKNLAQSLPGGQLNFGSLPGLGAR